MTSLLTLLELETKRKEDDLEWISQINLLPIGPKKWQEIAAFWMSRSSENRRQAMECIQVAKETRETRANKFGASLDPNSGLRMAFTMPGGLLTSIEVWHRMETGKKLLSGRDSKKYLAQLKQAFPEYQASEVL